MTTSIKVEAHCAPEKEVVVSILDEAGGRENVLQDGERYDCVVYDDKKVTVRERVKATARVQVKPQTILMTSENRTGYKLEDLLGILIEEINAKNAKLSKITDLPRDTINLIAINNGQLIHLLAGAKEIQEMTMVAIAAARDVAN